MTAKEGAKLTAEGGTELTTKRCCHGANNNSCHRLCWGKQQGQARAVAAQTGRGGGLMTKNGTNDPKKLTKRKRTGSGKGGSENNVKNTTKTRFIASKNFTRASKRGDGTDNERQGGAKDDEHGTDTSDERDGRCSK